MNDLRFAVRGLARSPRLAVAAVLCVAIGIAAVVAIVTLVNAALLRSLPYPEADRLVRLWTSVAEGNPRSGVSIPDFEDIRRESGTFELLAATARERFVFLGEERAERMRGEAVSTDYFAITGARPQSGRVFAAEEQQRTGPRAMLISERVRQTWFGGATDVVGRTLRIDPGRPGVEELDYTVVGVMSPGFAGTVEDDVVDFWIPLSQFGSEEIQQQRDGRVLWVLGRLRAGVGLADAQQELTSVTGSLSEQHADANTGASGWLEPAGENWRQGLRGGLYTLQGAALLLLLIACINVANLLLARLAERSRELAVRQSLGAAPRRIMRQLLTESVVLAAAGGALGMLLSWWIVRLFSLQAAAHAPAWLDISMDLPVAVAAVLLMILTGVAFGSLPALRGATVTLSQALRAGGRGTVSARGTSATAAAMVIVQIAVTVLLLVGAGLLIRSHQALAGAELGYRTDNILRLAVSINASDYGDPEALRRFYVELVQELEATPGVASAGLIFPTVQPWSGFRPSVDYRQAADGEARSVQVHGHAIEPGFFSTMNMALHRGRMFSAADGPDAPPVAIVSRSFAELIAPDGNALEQNVELGGTEFRIVGIAANVQFDSPIAPTASQWRTERSPDHDVYVSLHQRPQSLVSIAVHTEVPPAALTEVLTRRINALAPRSPVHWVTTMDESLAERYGETRFYMTLLAGFATAALLLAATGLYALLANSVAQRKAEIGLRMALGARSSDVIAQVLHRGLALVVVGIALGVLLALASGGLIDGLLHGVASDDALVFAAVTAFLAGVALIAVWAPARRAARIDPMQALREE
jgi:putative ABC transport system permease protein